MILCKKIYRTSQELYSNTHFNHLTQVCDGSKSVLSAVYVMIIGDTLELLAAVVVCDGDRCGSSPGVVLTSMAVVIIVILSKLLMKLFILVVDLILLVPQ